MANETKVFPVEAVEGKKNFDKIVELESVANFNETMKILTTRYFATSLKSVETFGVQIQRTNSLVSRLHDIFTSVITTSRERLEQNPFGFEQDKKKIQGEIDALSAKLHAEEEITKSQAEKILELEKNEVRLEELTKENQESLQKIVDLQTQLHATQQKLQKIEKLKREKTGLEQQLSIAVETHKNEIIQISKQKDLEKQDEMLGLRQKLLTKHQEELSKEVAKREEVNNTVLELDRIIQQQTVDAAKVKNNYEKEVEELKKKAIEAKNAYNEEIAKLKEEIVLLKQQQSNEINVS